VPSAFLDSPIIRADIPWVPPAWAPLERELLDMLARAAVLFARSYARPDGTLFWRDSWSGMDGSDDPYEGFHNIALLYLLAGGEDLHAIARTVWDGITWQWTEYGQLHREFDAYYDWMHHGESLHYLYFLALADPMSLKGRQRAVRFAAFYTADDPAVPNYDPERRQMRSPITGSRGPRFRMTEEDWSTHRAVLDNYPPPFEDIPGVTGPTCPWTDDTIFSQVLARMNERMARGDVPLNLTATSLVTHAYLHTGEGRYRTWVLEYLAAWEERTARNGGIIPDNVGPTGAIGECMGGAWWGGYYGWRWPHGAPTILEPLAIAGCNALLLDGDAMHLDLLRSQLDQLWERGRPQDGHWFVPHKHRDDGWADYRSMDPTLAIYCWNMTHDERDLERVLRIGQGPQWERATADVGKGLIGNTAPWFTYIRGGNPGYPEQLLRATREVAERQLARTSSERCAPQAWNVHHWQLATPLACEGLVQLLCGAPMHLYHGGLLHAPLRYYDGDAQRPGLPPSVVALVETVDATSLTVTIGSLDLANGHEVVLQAGTFGEHLFRDVAVLTQEGLGTAALTVDGPWLRIALGPRAGIRLRLSLARYQRRPSYATPWSRPDTEPTRIAGREIHGVPA